MPHVPHSPRVQPGWQLGRSRPRSHLYTTQGLAFTYGIFDSGWSWLPTVAWRREPREGFSGVDFYAAAAVGHTSRDEGGGPELVISVGFVADFLSKRN